MTLREIYRAGITFWFGNHYKLDAYVLRDGKKHPFALICPGGAYMLVSEENEGHTFAAELNRRGISAFVLHYRCRRNRRSSYRNRRRNSCSSRRNSGRN